MALTEKLKAIADAIRGKTGKTEEMTLDQMATEIAGIQVGGGSGGSSAMHSGEFTPSENTLKLTLDVGTSEWTYFLLWTEDTATGHGVKSFVSLLTTKDNFISYVGTSNSGGALAGYGHFTPSYKVTFDGSMVIFSNGTSGSTLGYFIGGNTYNWIVL